MEIIYFIMIIFTESTLSSVQINAWHIYADEVGYNVPCERAIEDEKFQKLMGSKLRPGQKATLQCKSDPEMRPLQFLLAPGAVQIKPGAAQSTNEMQDGDAAENPQDDSAPQTLSGKLIHVPYKRGVKSVATYLGHEFFLETEELGRVALYTSDAVSKEELMRHVGKIIKLRARYVDRTPTPDPANPISYPIGEFGGPLKRAGYEVLVIK